MARKRIKSPRQVQSEPELTAADIEAAILAEVKGMPPPVKPPPKTGEERQADTSLLLEADPYGKCSYWDDDDISFTLHDVELHETGSMLSAIGEKLMNTEPLLPQEPVYFDKLVTNFRRYQRLKWKLPEEDILIHFGQSRDIKGVRNNYEFRATDGRYQTFSGTNHEEDADTDTYESRNLTRGYTVKEVIAIWLVLANPQQRHLRGQK